MSTSTSLMRSYVLNADDALGRHVISRLEQAGHVVQSAFVISEKLSTYTDECAEGRQEPYSVEAHEAPTVVWFPPKANYRAQGSDGEAVTELTRRLLDDAVMMSRKAVETLSQTGGTFILAMPTPSVEKLETMANKICVGGISLLARSLARHCALKEYNVRVNTAIQDASCGATASNKQFADLICYLASSRSSFVNGTDFPG